MRVYLVHPRVATQHTRRSGEHGERQGTYVYQVDLNESCKSGGAKASTAASIQQLTKRVERRLSGVHALRTLPQGYIATASELVR